MLQRQPWNMFLAWGTMLFILVGLSGKQAVGIRMRKRMNTSLYDGRLASNLRQAPQGPPPVNLHHADELASNLRQAPQPQVPAPLPLKLRHADVSHNTLALDLLQPQNHALHHADELALQLPQASPGFKPLDADHFKKLGIAPTQGSAGQMELFRVPETLFLAHLQDLDKDALVLHEHDVEHTAMRVTRSSQVVHSNGQSCPSRIMHQMTVEQRYASERKVLLAKPDGNIIEYKLEKHGIRPETEHEKNTMITLTALEQLEGKGGDVVQLDKFLESVPEEERKDFLDYLAMKKKTISPKTRYQFIDLNLELAEFQKYKDIFKASKPRQFLAIEDKRSQPIDIMGSQSGGSLVQKAMTPAEKQRFDSDVQEKAAQALEQRRLCLVRMEAPHEIDEWRIM